MLRPVVPWKVLSASAQGWYFVQTFLDAPKVMHRLAAWAQDEHGVFGLYSVRQEPASGQRVVLVPVPCAEGCYVHQDDLTDAEQAALSAARRRDA